MLTQMKRSMKATLEPEDRRFGERLKRFRQERDWTQSALAKKAKVDRSVIANYEQGVSFPPIPVLRRLALALQVSTDLLVFENGAALDTIDDRGLLEIFAKVDQLDYRTKDIIRVLVEGLLARQELERVKTGTDGQ